jgi:hypothetical protein
MGSSSPAWLAKDPAAQKHLGKYKEDPQGLVWYVFAVDTSRKGDVVRLRRVGSIERRSVPLKKLERDYKDVADDKQMSLGGEVCSDVELQATVEAMSGGPVKVTAYEDTGKPNMLWDPGEVKDAGILAQLPTFFVDANPGDERPVGVVVVLGDKKVRVKVVGMKDPRDLTQEIPAIELRPLQEPGKEGEALPAVTGGPLAVLAFRNPRAIATFMRALDHVEKKLTGETAKFVVQFDPAPRYPRVEVPTEEGWYWRAHRLWEVIWFGDGLFVFM